MSEERTEHTEPTRSTPPPSPQPERPSSILTVGWEQEERTPGMHMEMCSAQTMFRGELIVEGPLMPIWPEDRR